MLQYITSQYSTLESLKYSTIRYSTVQYVKAGKKRLKEVKWTYRQLCEYKKEKNRRKKQKYWDYNINRIKESI